MILSIVPGTFAVCRLPPTQDVQEWVWQRRAFLSVTYTLDELSIVCSAEVVPVGIQCEQDWAVMKVQGPLDFSLTGVLLSLVSPLAVHGIAIFALSTFDTDYILLKEAVLSQAKAILEQHGHTFQ